MIQNAIKVIIGIFFLYAGYCLLLYLFQRSILFPRFQIPTIPATKINISGLEKLWLDTGFGNVEAWYFSPASGNRYGPSPAVIFAHGNAELIDFWPEEFKGFTALGLGVLLVEYPGYGRSAGRPSQETIIEIFVAAYDRLVEKPDVDSNRIVLFGRSLGGGAACALAARRPSAALILLSTFTSVRACATKFLVPGFLVRDPFDNLNVLRSYAAPVLIIHGKRDGLIPYEHGKALYEIAEQGKMVSYDCGHNDCPPNWKMFYRDVESFLMDADIIPRISHR